VEKPADAQPNDAGQGPTPGTAPPPNPLLAGIRPEDYMTSLDKWIREYHDLPAPQPPVTAKDQLAAWAAQTEEKRSKSIDNMICECLGDDNFIKMVEELERHWKRVGLEV